MNEIVKYHNDMNTVNFCGFNAVELDLLLSICAKIRDESIDTVVYSFDELRSISEYKPTANKRFVDDLQKVNRKLLSLNFTISCKSKIIQFVLFKKFEIDLDRYTLTVSVNEEFSYILNELTANFTRFELDEFVNLQSKYAKNLYRLLKQYRTTGRVFFTMIDFCKKLDIPSSYKLCDIGRKVLNPIKTELSPLFPGFRIEKVKDAKKRGKPVTNIKFYFTPQKTPKSVKNETLDRIREVYLPDFTVDELKTLLHHGSVEYLKRASKQYDAYKQHSSKPIENKMGFMVRILQNISKSNEKEIDFDIFYETY